MTLVLALIGGDSAAWAGPDWQARVLRLALCVSAGAGMYFLVLRALGLRWRHVARPPGAA